MLEVLPWGVEESGPKSYSFDNSGTFISALLILGSTLMVGGGLAVVVLVDASLLTAVIMPILFGGVLAVVAWYRRRTMGRFLIDGEKRLFIHDSAQPTTWSFDQVSAIETEANYFVRNPLAIAYGQPRWLIAVVADGRHFRLCSGFKHELEPLLVEFRKLGLPVRS